MPISNERMNQYIRDALGGLEVEGDTDIAESAMRANSQTTQKDPTETPERTHHD